MVTDYNICTYNKYVYKFSLHHANYISKYAMENFKATQTPLKLNFTSELDIIGLQQ